MAETGFISLILALLASVYSIAAFALSRNQKTSPLTKSAKYSLLAVFGFMSLAIIMLLSALLSHDFRLAYVAENTSLDLPVQYLISALWAGNAGSLLLWGWILSLCAVVFILRRKRNIEGLTPLSSTVIMAVQSFFIIMLLIVNPFETLAITHPDGMGLNPLLRNVAMIFHPPLLLAGYVAFTIPFAIAIAALLTRKLNETWLIEARPSALIAWLMLGIGNLIGAWWAYVELGWGGYWAWDPVENAGLMPWLIGTAFLHSALIQARRKIFKTWTMFFIILAFLLTIFGAFLTRSDILSSVHTFGKTGTEIIFLSLFFLTLFGSYGLLISRLKDLKSEPASESIVSKEGMFLINNILFLVASLAILFATIFPAIVEATGRPRVNIGAAYHSQTSVPILLCILLLTGVCLIIGWKRIATKSFRRSISWPLGFAIILVIALFVAGVKWQATAAFSICGFVLWVTVSRFFRGTSSNSLWKNRNRYGAYIVHIAVALIAIGITGSSLFNVERSAILEPGESMKIKGYTLTYERLDLLESPSRIMVKADISVYQGKNYIGKLTPEKSLYRKFNQPVTEVAIRSTPVEDLYVILVEWDINNKAGFTVLVNPLVMWIWIGSGVFLIGGLICFWPRKIPDS